MTDSPGGIIWDWRARLAKRELERSHRGVRRKGLIQGLATIAVAAVVKYALDRAGLGNVILVVGAAQVLTAVWRPGWLPPIWRLGRRFGHAVGLGLTWILLVPFHALCVVPIGLLFRLQGKDLLARRRLETGLTGWIPRRQASTSESMMRQFIAEDRAARLLRRPEASLPGPEGAAASDPGEWTSR